MITLRLENSNICIATIVSHFNIDDVHQIIEYADENNIERVLLNMQNLELLTSTVIGYLIILYKSFHEGNIRFVVVHPKEEERKILNIAGIDSLVPVFDNIVAALGALK